MRTGVGGAWGRCGGGAAEAFDFSDVSTVGEGSGGEGCEVQCSRIVGY